MKVPVTFTKRVSQSLIAAGIATPLLCSGFASAQGTLIAGAAGPASGAGAATLQAFADDKEPGAKIRWENSWKWITPMRNTS